MASEKLGEVMSRIEQPQRVRQDPRLSMNGMMRYMTASASKRLKIIRDHKYTPPYQVIWYEAACGCIARFIAGGMLDESILTNEIVRLTNSVPANDQEGQKYDGNIEAIESCLNSHDQISFGDLTPSPGGNATPNLILSGVQISVRPDIELRGAVRNRQVVGAMKLYFAKNDPLTEETARFGATLVRRYCEANLAIDSSVRPADCSVYDVFGGQVFVAPSAMSRRIQDIEASCDEIALRWANI